MSGKHSMTQNTNNTVSIVTGFLDIGRGSWSNSSRSNEFYFECFERLASLENDMYIFTEEKFVDRIKKMRQGKKIEFEIVDLKKDFAELLKKISDIQNSEEFKSKINPNDLNNPDYSKPEYVLVNLLKYYFADFFAKKFDIKTDLLSWVDFGYVRDDETLNNTDELKLDFNKEKIHLFNLKRISGNIDVNSAILNNEVFIQGSGTTASPKLWDKLNKHIDYSLHNMMEKGIIDDDQGVLLDCYVRSPQDFELHFTDGSGLNYLSTG
jgi:protein YibB